MKQIVIQIPTAKDLDKYIKRLTWQVQRKFNSLIESRQKGLKEHMYNYINGEIETAVCNEIERVLHDAIYYSTSLDDKIKDFIYEDVGTEVEELQERIRCLVDEDDFNDLQELVELVKDMTYKSSIQIERINRGMFIGYKRLYKKHMAQVDKINELNERLRKLEDHLLKS